MEGKGFLGSRSYWIKSTFCLSKEIKMKRGEKWRHFIGTKIDSAGIMKKNIFAVPQAKTDWIEFAYGGRFVPPIFC